MKILATNNVKANPGELGTLNKRKVIHVARIAGVDLPRNKRMEVALTYIYGIGRSASKKILTEAGIDLSKKSDALD